MMPLDYFDAYIAAYYFHAAYIHAIFAFSD